VPESETTTEHEPLQRSRRSGRRGLGWLQLRGRIWWVGYTFRGRTYRESSRSDRRTDAVKLLRRRVAQIGEDKFIGPDEERVTFRDIKELLLTHYKVNGRRSVHRAEIAFRRLEEVFGQHRAVEIRRGAVLRYIERRLAAKVKPATVQYEVAMLRRALMLAVEAEKLTTCPRLPTVRVRNVRTGFFEEGEFRELLRHLPSDLVGLVEFTYLTGWRIGEVVTLTWAQIDFKAGVLRLEPGTTKNDEGRTFPFAALPRLEAVLQRQRELTTEVERNTDAIIPYVFHRDGAGIKELRGSWTTACTKAGLPGRIVHDFRRTAVRNLERAGVPRSVAMKLTGHKTESVYRRYAIVAEADLREGVAKLAKLHEGQAGVVQSPTVVPMNGRRPRTAPRPSHS
jgi:integrase